MRSLQVSTKLKLSLQRIIEAHKIVRRRDLPII
jgi:hypothetical protein